MVPWIMECLLLCTGISAFYGSKLVFIFSHMIHWSDSSNFVTITYLHVDIILKESSWRHLHGVSSLPGHPCHDASNAACTRIHSFIKRPRFQAFKTQLLWPPSDCSTKKLWWIANPTFLKFNHHRSKACSQTFQQMIGPWRKRRHDWRYLVTQLNSPVCYPNSPTIHANGFNLLVKTYHHRNHDFTEIKEAFRETFWADW